MRSPTFYYVAFFATGIATMSTGVLVALHGGGYQPAADADIGRLIAAQFGGQLVGSYFVGRHVASRLALGAAATAAAMAAQVLLGHLSLPLLFAMGLGLGLSMASINTLVGLESPESLRTKRLEILNVFWPLGAAFGPWLLARNLGRHTFTLFLTGLSLVFSAIAIVSALRRRPATAALEETPEPGASIPILLSLLALLAVGVESGLSNWLPTFQLRYLPAATLPVPLATLFWGSVLLSRMLASYWLSGRSERLVLVFSTLAAASGSLCVILSQTPWLLAFAVVGTAFAIGPVYPLLLTQVTRLPRRGVVFFCAAGGSALFPWLIGRSADASHSLRSAMLIPVAGSLVLCLLSGSKATALTPSGGRIRESA